MKAPISWIKDFVNIDLPLEELAKRLTMAGLEVEEIHTVGLPLLQGKVEGHSGKSQRREIKTSGLEWDREKIVVGAIHEVLPHPNADRLVLCRLDDGQEEQIILTGASNLFPFKGQGSLEKPIKVAYAKEGAKIYDGHQPGQVLTTLKPAKIRGVDSYSMACSEKELGISDEHEGIILLDEAAPVGMPLADYMGDAVFDIALTPNLARDACILGIAREIAAITGQSLRQPDLAVVMEGSSIQDRASIDIKEPELNPRFVLGLIENIEIHPSPYEVQRRLRLAGMRPINNIVDATNYAMLELGEPLHAFDYDVLLKRAGGHPPTIITRTAGPDEQLRTLDGADNQLEEYTVLVCDTAGPLSIAGVMGGEESEVSGTTRNILLEGAAWNYINIRRTIAALRKPSEAAYRFSRGVHPAMAERGVRRGLALMRAWTGGVVASGLIDNYPLPPLDPTVQITPADARRILGISLDTEEMADILRRLEFTVKVEGETLNVAAPDHRLDIGEGVIGVSDLMEEIARIYGYDRIPATRMADELPPQAGNPEQELEENIRDILVGLGLQEVISYRLTSPERERRRFPRSLLGEGQPVPEERPYVTASNPIASDRFALRQSLLASLLDIVEHNARIRPRIAIFEIGKVFLSRGQTELPDEPVHLAIALTGPRALRSWQAADTSPMDFYDLKGILESFFQSLHVEDVVYRPGGSPAYHPGKCTDILIGGEVVGRFGELHPQAHQNYEFPATPVLAAEIEVAAIARHAPERFSVQPVPAFPPVLEDLAVVIPESIPAEQVAQAIYAAGGNTVRQVQLFDLYRGGQAGPGMKSLAYRLTYQADERTLTDVEAARIRQRIVERLERDFGAKLRSG